MDKKSTKKKAYAKPEVEVIKMNVEYNLLNESPTVRPGGGGNGSNQGSVSVEKATEDNTDTELIFGAPGSSAKYSSSKLWE